MHFIKDEHLIPKIKRGHNNYSHLVGKSFVLLFFFLIKKSIDMQF